jgi:hypothetical protein
MMRGVLTTLGVALLLLSAALGFFSPASSQIQGTLSSGTGAVGISLPAPGAFLGGLPVTLRWSQLLPPATLLVYFCSPGVSPSTCATNRSHWDFATSAVAGSATLSVPRGETLVLWSNETSPGGLSYWVELPFWDSYAGVVVGVVVLGALLVLVGIWKGPPRRTSGGAPHA